MKNKIKNGSFVLMTVLLVSIIIFSCKKKEKTPDNTVTDADGNVYHSITIGTQVWMVENLKTTKYTNGDAIPMVTDNTAYAALTTGAYSNCDNNANNTSAYGKLYNWFAVNDTRGIAPTGWHIASDAEWSTLTTFLGGESVAGGKLKESGTAHWQTPNTGATNENGFLALPGGGRAYSGVYDGVYLHGGWWTSNLVNTIMAWRRVINYDNATLFRDQNSKNAAYSVRCIKN